MFSKRSSLFQAPRKSFSKKKMQKARGGSRASYFRFARFNTSPLYYSRTPLFRTRLIRSPRYFEGRSNSLGFTLMFSVIYYQLFRTRLFRIPCYFELIVLSLHLKSTPLFRTCQKQSTNIRAQLETYCILFKLVIRN